MYVLGGLFYKKPFLFNILVTLFLDGHPQKGEYLKI
jgi:hypothetical protein